MAEIVTMHSLLERSERLYESTEIQSALTQIAEQLTAHYAERNPLILCVMNGSLMTLGHLLPQLAFPLEIDYIHASRYGDETVGGEVKWFHQPASSLAGREVILVEDIVDQGHTLTVLRQYCLEQGVKSVSCATLVSKADVEKVGEPPEFIGLTVPNRYVFGFGMDYEGYWRNLPDIYAISKQDE